MQGELIENQREALEYAMRCRDRNRGEALAFAVGQAVLTLIHQEKNYYLDCVCADKRLDMLLYVKLLDQLLQQPERLNRILHGDYSDERPPQEPEAKVEKER